METFANSDLKKNWFSVFLDSDLLVWWTTSSPAQSNKSLGHPVLLRIFQISPLNYNIIVFILFLFPSFLQQWIGFPTYLL